MEAKDALRQIGLNEKEALVYTSLLQLGQTTAYAIAENCGLKRPTVYVVLEDLRRKGVVQKVPHAAKQLFAAKPPDVLVNEFTAKADLVSRSLPQLMALSKAAGKPNVLYFEGIDGVRQALYHKIERLRGSEIVGFGAQGSGASKDLLALFGEWNGRMKDLKIRIRGITPQHPSLAAFRQQDAEYGRKIKSVSAVDYDANVSVEVTDLFVRVIAFRDLQALIIENKDIASSLRQIFELVWKR